MEPRKLLALALNRLSGLSPRERLSLLEGLKRPEELLRVDPRGLARRGPHGEALDAGRALALAERDARHLTMGEFQCTFYWERAYPPQLREVFDPPVALYSRGRLPDWSAPVIAVVGTRHPTGSARRAAFAVGFELGAGGAVTVSGLARGIDSEAHRGSLDARGITVAVLGSAIDEIFPDSSRPLARKMLAGGGCLLSEYPPGVQARSHHFPARNRIISGLSRAVVVVQAPRRSGALITADFALEQGRELVVHAAGLEGQSGAGTRRLRDDGAAVLEGVVDIQRLIGETAGTAAAVRGHPAEAPTGGLEPGYFVVAAQGIALDRGEHGEQY